MEKQSNYLRNSCKMVQLKLEDISKYLTEKVVDRAFKLKTDSQDQLKSVEVSRAAPAGSGLIGAVYRLHVRGKNHMASFVAKGMVRDPLLRKSLRAEKYFQREIHFYSHVLPVLIEVQKSSGGQESIQNHIPICYSYHSDGKNDFLLMEDLAESFCSGVSSDPAKSDRDEILNTLAHLHALSMALEITRPNKLKEITNDYPELYYSEKNRAWYIAYFENAISINLTTLAEFEDPITSVYYKKYFDLVNGDPYGKMISLVSERSDHAVICHGDAWSPNFLRSESRTVAIDFQISRFASPVTDLACFMILCSKQCPNKKSALEAFKLYHDSLTYYLYDVGIEANEVYSWKDLNDDLCKYGKFGILAAGSSFLLLSGERCDVLEEFDNKYSGLDKIPLEKLWPLMPYKTEDEKMTFVNAVRITVDTGLI